MSAATPVGDAGAHDVIVVDAVARHFQAHVGLFRSRRAQPIRAVDGVSFSIRQGSCFAIVGESGSGKSTLARVLVGLLRPTEGVVRLDGESLGSKSEVELRHVRRKVQLVLQDPIASLDPRMKIFAILREALIVHRLHPGREAQRRRIEAVIRQVGLSVDHLHRYPHQLSGGQRQRVAIARALICEPEVLVLDEPVSALDVSVQAQIINLLMQLQGDLQLTYVIITHDLALVGHMADAIGVMYLGRLVEIGPASVVYRTPLHPYTQSLISIVASHDPQTERTRKIEILQGSVPNAAAIPPGCSFHTRCPRARKLARSMDPTHVVPSENGSVPANCAFVVPEPARYGEAGVTVTCHYAMATDSGQAFPASICSPGERTGS